PQYCSEHRNTTNVNLISRVCRHPHGCRKIPSFGSLEDGMVLFCAEHREREHVNLRIKRESSLKRAGIRVCTLPACKVKATFGPAGTRIPTVCRIHKVPGYTDLANRLCEADNCTRRAIYGIPKGTTRHTTTHHAGADYDAHADGTRERYNLREEHPGRKGLGKDGARLGSGHGDGHGGSHGLGSSHAPTHGVHGLGSHGLGSHDLGHSHGNGHGDGHGGGHGHGGGDSHSQDLESHGGGRDGGTGSRGSILGSGKGRERGEGRERDGRERGQRGGVGVGEVERAGARFCSGHKREGDDDLVNTSKFLSCAKHKAGHHITVKEYRQSAS
ncbi:hypothetical protein T484DRAFT_1788436, partial [Baffinella frigidus]